MDFCRDSLYYCLFYCLLKVIKLDNLPKYTQKNKYGYLGWQGHGQFISKLAFHDDLSH